jgi:hypothetical protein
MTTYILWVILAYSTPLHPADQKERLVPEFFTSSARCKVEADKLYAGQPDQGRYAFTCMPIMNGETP